MREIKGNSYCEQCTLSVPHTHNGSPEDFMTGGKQDKIIYNTMPSSTMSKIPIANYCEHWWRFLDFLGSQKNKGTFYCQKCLEIKEKEF